MTVPRLKQTEIGEFPEDWEIAPLSELVSKMASGGTPLISIKEYYNGNIPFAKIEDLTRTQKYVSQTETSISKNGLENSAAWVVPSNSILYSIYATLGEARITNVPMATNQAILAIIPKAERVYCEFLFYYLSSLKGKLTKFHKETTQKNLTKQSVKSFPIPLPPLPEQQKIASVLTTADDAIEKTRGIVEQLKQVKKGLMQELLTKGIGHKKFKEIEIGEIPEEWDILMLEDLCDNLDFMRKPITRAKREHGDTPYYGAMGVQDYVSGYIFDEDLLLVAEDCGEYGNFGQKAYSISGKSWVNNHAHILRCRNIDLGYLENELNYLDISRFINTGNRDKLNKSTLDKIPIPIPSKSEQKKIATILATADANIESEIQKCSRLETLKKGLMQDLLTGHVRFPEFIKGAK